MHLTLSSVINSNRCNREKGEALVAKLGGNSGFARVDIDDINSLETALKGEISISAFVLCFVFVCKLNLVIDVVDADYI